MRKVFVALWIVVGLFVLGLALVISAAFTTQTTEFAGEPELYLKFQTPDRHELRPSLATVDGQELKPDTNGYYLLRPKFETRETNIYDSFAKDGPLPRTAIVAFNEGVKHHEIQFVFDRHGRVWQAIVAFPDPTINDVEVVNSSLDFKGIESSKRHFDSTIYAKAFIGAPIIKND
jgi:hypothetical protein